MKNSIDYRECRYFKADNEACCRYYFVTICYGDYVEKVLQELSLVPTDIIVMNSCLWDVHRHGKKGIEKYEDNLEKLVASLRRLLPDCLFLWLTTPPVNIKSKGGFLMRPGTDLVKINEVKFCNEIAREVFTQANNIDRRFRIVDLDAVFQYFEHHRASDGVHWNERAHRRMSNMILEEVSKAFNKKVPRMLGGDNNPWDNNMQQQQQHSNEFENFHEPQQPLRWDDFDQDAGWGHRPPFPLPGHDNWNNERFDDKWGFPNERGPPPGPPGFMFSPNRPPMPPMHPFGPRPMMMNLPPELFPELDDLGRARDLVEHQQEIRNKRKNRDDEVTSPTVPEIKYRFGVTSRKRPNSTKIDEPSTKVTIVDGEDGVMKKLVELGDGVTLHSVLSEKERNAYHKDLADKEQKRKEKERLEKQEQEEKAAQAKAAEEKRVLLEKKKMEEEKVKLSEEMNVALNEVNKLPLVSEIPIEEKEGEETKDVKKENTISKLASKLLSIIKNPVDAVKSLKTSSSSSVGTDKLKSEISTAQIVTTSIGPLKTSIKVTTDSAKTTVTITSPTTTSKTTINSSMITSTATTTFSSTPIELTTTTVNTCINTPSCSTSNSMIPLPTSLTNLPIIDSTSTATSSVDAKTVFCYSDAINTARSVVPVFSVQKLAPSVTTKLSSNTESSSIALKPVAPVDTMALLSQLSSPFAKQKPKSQQQQAHSKVVKKPEASDVIRENPMNVSVSSQQGKMTDSLNDTIETDFESSLLDGDQEDVDETLSDVDESILEDNYVPSLPPPPAPLLPAALKTVPLDEKPPKKIAIEQKLKALASTSMSGKMIDMTNKKLPTQKKKIAASATASTSTRKRIAPSASSDEKQQPVVVKKRKKDKHPNETKEERRIRKQKKKERKEKLKANKITPRSATWAPSYYPTYENEHQPHQPNQQAGMFGNYANQPLLAQQQHLRQQHLQQQRQRASMNPHQIQQPPQIIAGAGGATGFSQHLQQVNASIPSSQPQAIATTNTANQQQLYIDEYGITYTMKEETCIVGADGHIQRINTGTPSNAYVQQQQALQQYSQPSLIYGSATQQAMQQQARYL